MTPVSAWLESFRLRTLPLSLSTIILGSFLAAFQQKFQLSILIWSFLTTLFLQILSNLANDYGDTVQGVDNQDRIGPQRSLQTGAISLQQMKTAIIVFIFLALISGIILIIEASKGLKLSYSFGFFILGIGAIIAALKYTMGKKPYGYAGLGDAFVFIFFGLVGVLGTYVLHTHDLPSLEVLPAISMGCFSAGVLNLNNLRDRKNDATFGKNTLVVQLGVEKTKIYHAILLSIGMFSAVIFTSLINLSIWKWIYLLAYIGIIRSIIMVYKNEQPALLDPELKKLAISTLLFSILFGIGLLI